MRITNARWTAEINYLAIKCDCGAKFERRADRVKVVCPECGKIGNMHKIKEKGVKQMSLTTITMQEKEIELEESLQVDIENGIMLRAQASELKEESKKLEDQGNSILAPALLMANIKTTTFQGIGRVTFNEGKKNSPTCKVEDFEVELLKRGVDAKVVKAARKAATKDPEKPKGDPTVSFTPWAKCESKRGKRGKNK